jgi:hypothetical protein
MISRQTVRQFFKDNASEGVDLDRPMLWGFFWLDRSDKVPAGLREVLEARGYAFVDVLGPEPEDTPPYKYFFHFERVEQLTASLLYQRVLECEALAEEYGLLSFDGFDVGNVDGSVLRS